MKGGRYGTRNTDFNRNICCIRICSYDGVDAVLVEAVKERKGRRD